MARYRQRVATETIVLIGLLGAIAIFLSITRIGVIPLPNFSGAATVVHVPAELAGILGGSFAGGAVGLLWGVFSWLTADVPLFADPLVAIVPRILVGIVTALVWRALRRGNRVVALGVAAWIGTLTNTVLVLGLAVLRKYMPMEAVVAAIPQSVAEQILAIVLTIAVAGAYFRARPPSRVTRQRPPPFVPEPVSGDTQGIRVERLHHDYLLPGTAGTADPVPAVRGVDLHLRPGEFVAVLGRNGSGKSTLARHLNALLLPSEGRVLVDGVDTRDPARTWDVRRAVGMVFQNPDNQLIATVVADDIAFGMENLGLPADQIAARVAEVSAALGIEHLLSAEPAGLSGGEKQLVAIAGVLAMRPRYLLLDEPAALLSESDAARVLDAVLAMHATGTVTVVLITHRMADAARAQRIVVLHQGTVAMEGPPRTVFAERDRIRELGLDVPVATEIAHLLGTEHGMTFQDTPLTADELADALETP